VPINWWSQAHFVGLIAPNFSARVSKSDINDAGPVVPVVADYMLAAEAHKPAEAAGIAALAVVLAAGFALLVQIASKVPCPGYPHLERQQD